MIFSTLSPLIAVKLTVVIALTRFGFVVQKSRT